MGETRFDAQALTDTATKAATQTFEMVLVNASGDRLRITLPIRIAADALVPVLHQLALASPPPAGAPQFSKNVATWRVGRSNEEPKVLIGFDELLYALHVTDAKKLWRDVREEAEIVSRRPPPTRQ